MAERILNIHQQIALLPATIPDSILDFLEDFHLTSALQSETARAAYDPEYLKLHGEKLKTDYEALCKGMGPLRELHVEPAGREIAGGFLLKLTFEYGPKGVAILTTLKERTIRQVIIQPDKYSEPELKELLKNPPKLG